MSTPPNRYRDLHREVQALGNRASGLGLLAEASSLWAVAAAIKAKGRPDPCACDGTTHREGERDLCAPRSGVS